MRWFRTRIVAVLAAGAFLAMPMDSAPAQTRPDRLCRGNCWYRVYYRVCANRPWCYYATYNDCHKAQLVVDYLHLEGCEAYMRPVASETGS